MSPDALLLCAHPTPTHGCTTEPSQTRPPSQGAATLKHTTASGRSTTLRVLRTPSHNCSSMPDSKIHDFEVRSPISSARGIRWDVTLKIRLDPKHQEARKSIANGHESSWSALVELACRDGEPHHNTSIAVVRRRRHGPMHCIFKLSCV